MYHDLYMGEDRFPVIDQFDINLPTSKMLANVVEALAQETYGDELMIVVRTHRQRHEED